jgi:hypothetical protein
VIVDVVAQSPNGSQKVTWQAELALLSWHESWRRRHHRKWAI